MTQNSYSDAVTTAILADGLRDPHNSQLQDFQVVAARREAERRAASPPPPSDKVGFITATVAGALASGAIRDGDDRPDSIAAVNERLVRQKEAEESARLKRLFWL